MELDHSDSDNLEVQVEDPDFFNFAESAAKPRGPAAPKASSLPLMPSSAPFNYDQWDCLGLSRPLLRSLPLLNFSKPTRIQATAIPAALSGKDILGCSETGSGKTAAFLLPIMELLLRDNRAALFRALIVVPTRELAMQGFKMFQAFNVNARLRAMVAVGKADIGAQEFAMRRGVDIIFGTPGRLVDLSKNSKGVDFETVEHLVFDEADKLLEMGFKAEIDALVAACENPKRQTLLFSATLDKDIRQLCGKALKSPIRIEPEKNSLPSVIEHQVIRLKNLKSTKVREAVLLYAIENLVQFPCIVFFKTKAQCHRSAIMARIRGHKVEELGGDLTSIQRTNAVKKFSEDRSLLFSTDLACRGLDFPQIAYVINFEFPTEVDRYIHRSGRTGRAGAAGICLNLFNDKEYLDVRKILKKSNIEVKLVKPDVKKVKEINDLIDGYEQKIRQVTKQETANWHLERAEMEVKKAQNMLEFQEEIKNRPRREWIVSNEERQRIREESKPKDRYEEAPSKKEKSREKSHHEELEEGAEKPRVKDRHKNRPDYKGKSKDKANARAKSKGRDGSKKPSKHRY